MQQSCNMQSRSHAALFQPHPFLGAIVSTTLLSDCNTFRLLFMLTWPVLRRDNLSCSARIRCSTLPTLVPACRMARTTMTAKRYHHQSKADKTPQQGKNYQAKDSDKHSLTCISHLSRHSLVAVLP
jgi:hypothetical protein